MSKAILVLDMPNSCNKCPCFCGHYSDMCCMALITVQLTILIRKILDKDGVH